jgi:hypothetical protein
VATSGYFKPAIDRCAARHEGEEVSFSGHVILDEIAPGVSSAARTERIAERHVDLGRKASNLVSREGCPHDDESEGVEVSNLSRRQHTAILSPIQQRLP